MFSIHHTMPTLNITRNLGQNLRAQSSAMEKLSSGFRINKAADDPAGLIMSEKLQAQIEGLDRAIRNTEDADSLMSIMDGGLAQVQNILKGMQKLAVQAANSGVTSADQTSANQAEMDNALLAINKILETTNMGGRKLLNDVNLFNNAATPTSIVPGKDASALERPSLSTVDGDLVLDRTKLGIDTTFTIEGVGENGDETMTVDFKKGASIDDVLKQLQELDLKKSATAPTEGTETPADETAADSEEGGLFRNVAVNAASIENLKNLSGEEATQALTDIISQAPLPEGIAELDTSTLSKADQMLVSLSDKLSGLNLGSLGGTQIGTGKFDENGEEILTGYSLNDLFSGGKASLSRDPALALRIIKDTHQSVSALRADIGATMAMREHERMAKQAELENVTKMDSLIRDTDMASTMIEYSRTTVLAQVGTNLLKQSVENSRMLLDLFV